MATSLAGTALSALPPSAVLANADELLTAAEATLAAGVTSINSAIKNLYNAVEPWVEWGFDVAAYVVSWIPWVGLLSPQIPILYDFGEAIVRSIVFNVTDWLFGPLPFLTGLRNVIGDTWDASWNLLWDELDWLLPPLPPLPPIPPCPQILCDGVIGNTVVAASGVLRDVSLGIWSLWDNPIKPLIDGGVDLANDVFDALAWIPFVPLIKFETNAVWDVTQGLVNPLVGFAKDMITAGDAAVADFFEHGLFTAVANAASATWESITLRGGEAIDAVVTFLKAQWDYFTGGFLGNPAAVRSVEPEQKATLLSAYEGIAGSPIAKVSDTVEHGGQPEVREVVPADGGQPESAVNPVAGPSDQESADAPGHSPQDRSSAEADGATTQETPPTTIGKTKMNPERPKKPRSDSSGIERSNPPDNRAGNHKVGNNAEKHGKGGGVPAAAAHAESAGSSAGSDASAA